MRPSGNKRLLDALATEMRARRTELDISQEELALRCTLDRPYVTLLEGSRKQPTLSVLYKIAVALELSFNQFAARIDKRYKALPLE